MPALARKNAHFILATALFLLFSLWWLYDYLTGTTLSFGLVMYSNTYFLMAFFAGLYGLVISRKWGSVKSHLGKTMMFLSLGLLAQVFGQLSYSYLTYVMGIEVPYPSIGDLGYFGSIPLYIFGVLALMKVVKTGNAGMSKDSKVVSVLAPAAMLFICYIVFLNNRVFTFEEPLKSFLDFGYPLFQSLYVSLALVALYAATKGMGGILRTRVLLLLFALVVQFIADFVFLYRADRGLVYPGGPTDYLYLIAYFVMALAIIDFGLVFEKLRNGKVSSNGALDAVK
ncbi:TPA: hypothetical protein DCY43_00650 [candidate division WWE3 bacterium]|uniref:Uncharacterized protein n=2 Tax=Katanobacteria TaxID=422282 RepID=A0A0G1NKE3_UNCKA|nr:MAG: hypothetical protein UW82_C0015G0012 [candidate division WWE3 bacterium GW2011_GWC2_44_9]HAZ29250.1 hypothetical protein [candidate division WWE3 bacterium]